MSEPGSGDKPFSEGVVSIVRSLLSDSSTSPLPSLPSPEDTNRIISSALDRLASLPSLPVSPRLALLSALGRAATSPHALRLSISSKQLLLRLLLSAAARTQADGCPCSSFSHGALYYCTLLQLTPERGVAETARLVVRTLCGNAQSEQDLKDLADVGGIKVDTLPMVLSSDDGGALVAAILRDAENGPEGSSPGGVALTESGSLLNAEMETIWSVDSGELGLGAETGIEGADQAMLRDMLNVRAEDPMETVFFSENRKWMTIVFEEIPGFASDAEKIICGEDAKHAHELIGFLCSSCFSDFGSSAVTVPLLAAFCKILEECSTDNKMMENREKIDSLMNALMNNGNIGIHFVAACLRLAKAAKLFKDFSWDWVSMVFSDLQRAISFFNKQEEFKKDGEKRERIARDMKIVSGCKYTVTVDAENGTKIEVAKLADMDSVKGLIFNAEFVDCLVFLYYHTFVHTGNLSEVAKISQKQAASLILSTSGDSSGSESETSPSDFSRSMRRMFREESPEVKKDAESDPKDEKLKQNSANSVLYALTNVFTKYIFCKKGTSAHSSLFSCCFGNIDEFSFTNSILDMAEFVSGNKENFHVVRNWVDFVSSAASATETFTSDFFSSTSATAAMRLFVQDGTEKEIVDKMSKELLYILGIFWIALVVTKSPSCTTVAKDIICQPAITSLVGALYTPDAMSDAPAKGCPFTVTIEMMEMILFVLYSFNNTEFKRSVTLQLLNAVVSFSKQVSSSSVISPDSALYLSDILFMLEFLLTHTSDLPLSLSRGFRNQIIAHPAESLVSETGLDFSLQGVSHFTFHPNADPASGPKTDIVSWNKKLPFAAGDMFFLPYPIDGKEYTEAFNAIRSLLSVVVVNPDNKYHSSVFSTALQNCLLGFASRTIPPPSYFTESVFLSSFKDIAQNPLDTALSVLWSLYIVTKTPEHKDFGALHIPPPSFVNLSSIAAGLPACIDSVEKAFSKGTPEQLTKYLAAVRTVLLSTEMLFPDFIAASMPQVPPCSLSVPRTLASQLSEDPKLDKILLEFAHSCFTLCYTVMGAFVKTALEGIKAKSSSVLDMLNPVDFIMIANIASAKGSDILSGISAAFDFTLPAETKRFADAFGLLCKKHIEAKREPAADDKDLKTVFATMELFPVESSASPDFVANQMHEVAVLAARAFIDIVAVAMSKKQSAKPLQEALVEIGRFIATFEACPLFDDIKLLDCAQSIVESAKRKKDVLDKQIIEQTIISNAGFIRNITTFCCSEEANKNIRFACFEKVLLSSISKLKEMFEKSKKDSIDKTASLSALLSLAFSSVCPATCNAASDLVSSVLCTSKGRKTPASPLLATEKELCLLCNHDVMKSFTPDQFRAVLTHFFSFSSGSKEADMKKHPFSDTVLLLFRLCTFSSEFCSFVFDVLFPAIPHFLTLSATTHKRFLPFFMILEHAALGAGPKAFTALFSFAMQTLADLTSSSSSMEEGKKDPTPAHSVLIRIAERLIIFSVHDPSDKTPASFSDMPGLVSLQCSNYRGSSTAKKGSTRNDPLSELNRIMHVIQEKVPFWKWASKGEVFHEDPRYVSSHCTFVDAPPREYITQPYYRCYDCFPESNQGCCSTCACVCHSGHDLTFHRPAQFFCDCGAGAAKKPCSCIHGSAEQFARVAENEKQSQKRAEAERAESKDTSKKEEQPAGSLEEVEEAELSSICPELAKFNTYEWFVLNAGKSDSMEETSLIPDAEKMADEFARAIKPLFNVLAETQQREFPLAESSSKPFDVPGDLSPADPEAKKYKYALRHFVEHPNTVLEKKSSRFLFINDGHAVFTFNIFRPGQNPGVIDQLLAERKDFRTPIAVLKDFIVAVGFRRLVFLRLSDVLEAYDSERCIDGSRIEIGIPEAFYSAVSHPFISNLFVAYSLTELCAFVSSDFSRPENLRSSRADLGCLQTGGIQDFVLSVMWHPTEPLLAVVTVQGSLHVFDFSDTQSRGPVHPLLSISGQEASGGHPADHIDGAFFVRPPVSPPNSEEDVLSHCRGAVVAILTNGQVVTKLLPGKGRSHPLSRELAQLVTLPDPLSAKGKTVSPFSILPVSQIPGTSIVLATTRQGTTFKVTAHLPDIQNINLTFDPPVLVYEPPKDSRTIKYSACLCGEGFCDADEHAALIISINPDSRSSRMCAIAMDGRKAVASKIKVSDCLQAVVLPSDPRLVTRDNKRTVRTLLLRKNGSAFRIDAYLPDKEVGSSSESSSDPRQRGGGGDGNGRVPQVVEWALEKKPEPQFSATMLEHLQPYTGPLSVEIPGSTDASRTAERKLSGGNLRHGEYFVNPRNEYTNMTVSVRDRDFCVLAVQITFGAASTSHIPKRVSVDGHSRETLHKKARAYDFKRTIPEVLAHPGTVHIATSGCEDRSNPPVIDGLVLLGLPKRDLGLAQWPGPKKAEALLEKYNEKFFESPRQAAAKKLREEKERTQQKAAIAAKEACDAFGGMDGSWRNSGTGILSVVLNHVLNGVRLYGQKRGEFEKRLGELLPQFLASPAVHRSTVLREYLESFVEEVGVNNGLDQEQSLWLSDRPALAYLIEGRQGDGRKEKPRFVARHVAEIVREVCHKRPQNIVRFAQDMAQHGQGNFFEILTRLCNEDSGVVQVVLDVFSDIVAALGRGKTENGPETLQQVCEALLQMLGGRRVSVRMTVTEKFPDLIADALLKKVSKVEKPFKSGSFNCDCCSCSPIEGVRWHCEECPDFDLCDVCHRGLADGTFQKRAMPGSHKTTHRMTEHLDGVMIQCAGCKSAELQLVWWQCVECKKCFCPKCREGLGRNAHEPVGHVLKRCVYTEARETQQLLLASLFAGVSVLPRGSDTANDPAAEMAKQMSMEQGFHVKSTLPNPKILSFLSDERVPEELFFEAFVTGIAKKACETASKCEDPTMRLRYLLFAFKCLDKFSEKNRLAALEVTRSAIPHILEATAFVAQNCGKHPTAKLTSALVDMHYLSACFEAEQKKHSEALDEEKKIEEGVKKSSADEKLSSSSSSDASAMEEEKTEDETTVKFSDGVPLTAEFIRNLYLSLKSLVPILKEGKVVQQDQPQDQPHEGEGEGDGDMEEEPEEDVVDGESDFGSLLRNLERDARSDRQKLISQGDSSMQEDIMDIYDDADDSELMLWAPVLPVFSSTLPALPSGQSTADFPYGVFALGALLRLLVSLRQDTSSLPSSPASDESLLTSDLWRQLVCEILESDGLERSGLKTLAERAAVIVCGSASAYHLLLDGRRYSEHVSALRSTYEASGSLRGELAPAAEGRLREALDAMGDLSTARPDIWRRYCAAHPSDARLLFDFLLALAHGRVHGAVPLARTLAALLAGAVSSGGASDTVCPALLASTPASVLEEFAAELCVLHPDHIVRSRASETFRALLAHDPDSPALKAAATCGMALFPAHSYQAGPFAASLSQSAKEKASLDTASLVSLLRRSNAALSAHADAPLYSSYRRLAGEGAANVTLALVGTHPCGECLARAAEGAAGEGAQREKRTQNSMSNLCGRLAYTSRSVVGVLKSARILTGVKVTFQARDAASRAPKQVSVYVTVRGAASAKDLCVQRSVWTRVASTAVEPGAQSCSLSFAPADAACVMVEFTDLHDRKVAARLQCPRCGSVVAERHGMCQRCNESAYQCRGCRFIPYGDPDCYLCVQCGRSKDISYEITIESEEGLVVPPVETEQEFDLAMQSLERANEQAARKAEDIKDLRRLAWS